MEANPPAKEGQAPVFAEPPVLDAKQPPAGESGGSWMPGCLIGCGLLAVLLVVACGLGGWYVAHNAKQMAAGAVRNAIVQVIRETEMSAEDQQAVIVQVDRVVDAYKAGEISLEEVSRVLEKIAESPLIASTMVYYAYEQYVQPSGLDEQEKQQARTTLQRVMRGVVEKQISEAEIDELLQKITVTGPEGERQLKQSLSDEELRAFLADARAVADQAGVPDEPYEVNIGEEIKRAVDEALGSAPGGTESSGGAAAELPAEAPPQEDRGAARGD